MSFKNGDRSRAHRLHKLRNKLRLKTRALRASASKQTSTAKPAR